MKRFDIVVIGAGPTAIAALKAIRAGRSVAVISGAVAAGVPLLPVVHPKIRAVSASRDEAPGLDCAFRWADQPDRPLFASASAGGLANYWGQQFVRYGERGPWPRELFPDFDAYLESCAAVEDSFTISGGADVATLMANDRYRFTIPRLVSGSCQHPDAGLQAMRLAFRAQVERSGAVLLDTRANTVCYSDNVWCIDLADGNRIAGAIVVLAAGVVGTAQLLSRSFREIQRMCFTDHAPWMMYTVGMRAFYARTAAYRQPHFNALTLEKGEADACRTFASLYDMGQADLNLLLASSVGRTAAVCNGRHAPRMASLLKPVQVWTPLSFARIELDAKTGIARAHANDAAAADADADLSDVRSVLKVFGARCLHVSRTEPGSGFHYHNLLVESEEGEACGVAAFLRRRGNGRLVCVDASVLTRIGLRPHTLTAMASSWRVTRDLAM